MRFRNYLLVPGIITLLIVGVTPRSPFRQIISRLISFKPSNKYLLSLMNLQVGYKA